MLKLYYTPTTISFVIYALLEEVKAEFEAIKIDFATNDQNSDHYKSNINPLGRVPALQTPDGILCETIAIADYIDATNKHAQILPEDPFRRARAIEVCTYLATTAHISHTHGVRGYRWADDQASWDAMKAKTYKNMVDACTMIEQRYLQSPWALGERFSVADPYLYIIVFWAKNDGVDLAKFPKISAHIDLMQTRPAIDKVSKIMGTIWD